MGRLTRKATAGRNDTWSLAVVFGLASVPWTYAFVAGLHVPLWPSFVASATYFAVDEPGLPGLAKAYASNFAGVCYGAATIAVVDAFLGGGVLALSVVVGVFMFLASLHARVPLLSFVPGAFFGFATMFSVHAAGASAFGVPGLGGETLAALAAMLVGAVIGVGADLVSERVA